MTDNPSNYDLALQIATLTGKLDGYQQTVKLELMGLQRDLERSMSDREGIHRELESLKTWRAWITGVGSGVAIVVSSLSLYAALHIAGVHF